MNGRELLREDVCLLRNVFLSFLYLLLCVKLNCPQAQSPAASTTPRQAGRCPDRCSVLPSSGRNGHKHGRCLLGFPQPQVQAQSCVEVPFPSRPLPLPSSARAGLLLAALIARSSSPRARRSRARCWSCAAMPSGSPTLSRHWGRWWLPSRWFWGLLSCNLFSSCSLLLVTVWPAVCLVSRSFHPFTLFFFDSMLSLPRLW